MATRILRDRLNYTRDGLSGQPIAIVVIPPRPARPTATARPIATAKTPSGTQIPTPITPQPPVAFTTQQAAPIAIPTAVPLVIPTVAPPATLIVTPAALATPPGLFAQYLHPSTARDRLNHTLDGLAIGPESVQPIATAATPPGMQLPTPTAF